MEDTTSTPANPPVALRIVRGEPTPEELAALAAVVGAAGDARTDEPRAERLPRGRWNDPRHGHRRYWPVGPDGWRSAR
jgi:Acyl-CoA carboxylase epsilon subunit